MPTSDSDEITALLQRWRSGGSKDEELALFTRLYPLLRQLAAHRLRRSAPMTWQPTDLIGEAYARLFPGQRADFRNRQHFLAIAARVMRRVVADHFRERGADKRGGAQAPLSLDQLGAEADIADVERVADLVEVDRLLDELSTVDPRAAEIVELRYFAGLTVPEVGDVLELSERTVKRSWQFARAWLHARLEPGAPAT
ncbi:ECF-type sigma factor [Dokdonella sp.]|uniref:ECF-type sigma factor n=1 Tax=Dokdonella sp. TaxID=2291710 RepID=UPI002F422881